MSPASRRDTLRPDTLRPGPARSPGPARRRPDGTPGGRGPPELTPGAGPGPADLHERDMGDLKKAIRSSRGVIFPDSKFRTM